MAHGTYPVLKPLTIMIKDYRIAIAPLKTPGLEGSPSDVSQLEVLFKEKARNLRVYINFS